MVLIWRKLYKEIDDVHSFLKDNKLLLKYCKDMDKHPNSIYRLKKELKALINKTWR